MNLIELMQKARSAQASDLILVAGKPPCVYIHGQLEFLDDDLLVPQQLNDMLQSFLTEHQRQRLQETGDVDFSFGSREIGRVRINFHKQRNSFAAAVRFLSSEIPTFEALNLPSQLSELAQLPRGLVLVTGATGSGKSTTLASMIEYINNHYARHVITLEDPIEFLFRHRKSVIEQREIGDDSPSFAQALRHVVRQKPDVILVGEMRDRETIATALTAAETGHLVLGTLHTNGAAQTIERVIDVFESTHQPQIRIQLANTLRAVVCQNLLRRADHQGMIPAIEVMAMTPAIRRAIRESDTHLIPGMIETGQKFGMRTMDQALADAVAAGLVAPDTALAKAADGEKLERMIGPALARSPGQTANARADVTDAPIETMTGAGSEPWS